ncbi:MAG TPA: tol-pal system-associated acyl-CoA thioesterase [Steroidobacteraceae bacterium]|nr:tol-pal system-associated acyl-CoA thioesterase [Steroidobacteraceae bacterium]
MSEFLWHARVYWEDTDAGGVVYYANYLRFLERARTEWLRARGYHQSALVVDPGVVFAVTGVELRYRRPARLDDELAISCRLEPDGSARLAFHQQIWRDSPAGELLLKGVVSVACLDSKTFRPRRLPDFLNQALA